MKSSFLVAIIIVTVALTSCTSKQQQAQEKLAQEQQVQEQLPSEETTKLQEDFSNRKPFQFTITTDMPVKEIIDAFAPKDYHPGLYDGKDEEDKEFDIDIDMDNVEYLVEVNSVDGKYPVNYDLDCDGDGVYEYTGLSESHLCIFKRNTGEHQISVRGNIPSIFLCHKNLSCLFKRYGSCSSIFLQYYIGDESEDWRKIVFLYNPVVSIDSWGDVSWKSMNQFADFCMNLNKIPVDAPDLHDVKNMSGMFMGAASFNQPLENWDVSNVTDMSRMFEFAVSFNQPLEKWNVSNVTNMGGMFWNAKSFNQPLEKWNVFNVTNMSGIFWKAKSFNQPLENWNVSNVTNMSLMFGFAESFNQPLEKWNVSNVTNMEGMFDGAVSFNQPLEKWDVSNVTNMAGMFDGAVSFNQPLENWDVSNVTDMSRMFNAAKSFDQPLDKWNTFNVEKMNYMFYAAEKFKHYPKSWIVPDGETEGIFWSTAQEKIAKRITLKTSFDNINYVEVAPWCQSKQQEQMSPQDWAKSSNAFGLKLLRTMQGNTVFSPYSIERCLGMLLEGACLSTADEMREALELPDAKRLSLSGYAVNQALKNVNPSTVLEIENDFWPDASISLSDDFISRITYGYHTKIKPLDYVHAPEQARQTINNTISNATNGRFQNLISPGEITNSTKIILTNAVYFNSKWRMPFKEENTEKKDFYNSNGVTQVDMMYQEFENHEVCVADDFAMIDLEFSSVDYGGSAIPDKGAYVLRIVLPTGDKEKRMELLKNVENKFTSDLENGCKHNYYDHVYTSVPKFKIITDNLSLKEKLNQMGMKRAFNEIAEFYGLYLPVTAPKPSEPEPLIVENIYHKALIEVDEQGAVASAVTYGKGFYLGIGPTPPPTYYTFNADHPFLFMIIEKSTGAALFMGRITDL